MEYSTQLQPLFNQALIALLILGAVALSIVMHRKNLLDLLVAKQAELIAKLREMTAQPAPRTEQSLAHLRAMVKWLQACYRRDYAASQQPPPQVTTPEQLQQVVMAAALQTLGKEFNAMQEHREPEATWDDMQSVLHKLLEPVCTAAVQLEQEIEPVSEPEPESDVELTAVQDELTALQEQLAEARTARAKLEHELDEMQALYQRLLDEIEQQTAAIPEAKHVAEWITQRRGESAAAFGRVPQPSGTEVGELTRKALSDSLQKSEAEMRSLRNTLAGQHELVAKIKYKLSQQDDGEGGQDAVHHELPEWTALESALRESETCIKTLEMELEETHGYAHRLETEVKVLKQSLSNQSSLTVGDEVPRENKELVDTIKVMENAAEGYAQEIQELRKELEHQRNINFVLRDQLGSEAEGSDTEEVREPGQDDEPEPLA